jgi:hypothetical protein
VKTSLDTLETLNVPKVTAPGVALNWIGQASEDNIAIGA